MTVGECVRASKKIDGPASFYPEANLDTRCRMNLNLPSCITIACVNKERRVPITSSIPGIWEQAAEVMGSQAIRRLVWVNTSRTLSLADDTSASAN